MRLNRQAVYASYIASPAWRSKREDYWDEQGRHCQSCGSYENLHVHHHTYARLGHEQLTDLVGLCEQCHALVHQLHNSMGGRMSLTRATERILGCSLSGKPLLIEMPRIRKTEVDARCSRALKKNKKAAGYARKQVRRQKPALTGPVPSVLDGLVRSRPNAPK